MTTQIRVAVLYLFLIVTGCAKQREVTTQGAITSISLGEIKIEAQIFDASKGEYTLTVPYQTNLTAIAPQINVSTGVTIVPASGQVQNFTKPVYYTLINSDGSKVVYTIIVKAASQPSPTIASISPTSLEAGEVLRIKGENFGKFQLDAQVYLIDSQQKQYKVESKLIDSTEIRASIPTSISPQAYQVQVQIKELAALSVQKIQIQYPSPQILTLNHQNMVQGDSLEIDGNFLISSYSYQILLSSAKQLYTIKSNWISNGKQIALNDQPVEAGNYQVFIQNISTNKISKDSSFVLRVNDKTKPYINGILGAKPSYQANEAVIYQTANFTLSGARFYQIALIGKGGSYYQNALYDPQKSTLTLLIPTGMSAGAYQQSFSLLDSAANQLYQFTIDQPLFIK